MSERREHRLVGVPPLFGLVFGHDCNLAPRLNIVNDHSRNQRTSERRLDDALMQLTAQRWILCLDGIRSRIPPTLVLRVAYRTQKTGTWSNTLSVSLANRRVKGWGRDVPRPGLNQTPPAAAG